MLLSCLPCSVSWTVSCSVSATHRTCETTACTTHTAETLTTTAAPTQPWWKVSRTTPSAWNKPELPPPRCFYSTAFNLHQSLKDMEDGGDTFIFCLCGGNYWMLFDHTCPSKQNLPHWCRPCGHRPAARLSVRLSLKLRSRDTPPDSLDTSTFSWLDVVPSPTCPRAQSLWWRWAKSIDLLYVLHSQQDAQEFLRFLLDGLHNEVNRVTVRPRGTVEDFDHLPWVMHLNDDDLWNCEVNPEEKECMNSVSTPDKRTTLQSCHICVVILCHRKGIFKVDEWQ